VTSNDFQSDLIFDLGMHKALDTKYYLDKGFRVVALEANPKMVTAATAAHAKEIETGQLIILSCAFWSAGGQTISFFLNSVKDDWSSGFKEWAEKGGHASAEITVATVTLARLFDLYGVPYYIKCDIEGADELFVRQLLADRRRPAFVSIEAISLDALALLFAAGYDCVQIVNQAFNGFVEPPNPAREGKYVPIQFNGHMSGLFGRELDLKGWLTFSEAAQNYMDFSRLTKRDEKLAHGWLDFHLTSNAIIKNLPLGS
jgi:FkbM family methyltransferase